MRGITKDIYIQPKYVNSYSWLKYQAHNLGKRPYEAN